MLMEEHKNSNHDDRIFLICDQCLWNVTCLNTFAMRGILGTNNLCPACNQEQLSSFPVKTEDSIGHNQSKKARLLFT